jgi:hypothetical protein
MMDLRRAGSRGSRTVSWQAAVPKGVLNFWRHGSISVARGAKWATKLVEGLCPPVLHGPGHPPPPPLPIRLPEPLELPGGVRPMPDQPVRSAAQATSAAAGPPSPVPGWVGMARVVLLRVCPSFHQLQTLLCAAFCAPEAVVSGFLPVSRDQRMLIPVGALRRMLLAIACLGHIQQRPGSDLPQLRAGGLHWLTSPGLPAEEVFDVISHLIWTHQTTDDLRHLLGPRSPLSAELFVPPALSLLDHIGRRIVRLTADCCPGYATQCIH